MPRPATNNDVASGVNTPLDLRNKSATMATPKSDLHLEPDGPPKPRQIAGWGGESPPKGRTGKKKKQEPMFEEDDRLQQNGSDEVLVIPELEDLQAEDLSAQIAAPPSVMVNQVSTYKQLDADLQKHAGLFSLDGDIDLKLLAKTLSQESEVTEEDRSWEWNKLFAEVSADIEEVWRSKGSMGQPQVQPLEHQTS